MSVGGVAYSIDSPTDGALGVAVGGGVVVPPLWPDADAIGEGVRVPELGGGETECPAVLLHVLVTWIWYSTVNGSMSLFTDSASSQLHYAASSKTSSRVTITCRLIGLWQLRVAVIE